MGERLMAGPISMPRTVLVQCIQEQRPCKACIPAAQFLLKQVQETPPDPRTMVPGLPPAFAELILKALAKKPADRWQTAEEFHQALDRVRV